MIRKLILPLLFFIVNIAFGQGKIHSHNDYTREHPFYDAVAVKAFSIEADIFLKDDSIFVAHTAQEIMPGKTLENLYLKPIQKFYNEPEFYSFQLMIDVKTDWEKTYPALLKLLNRYKKLFGPDLKRVNILISGNRPANDAFRRFPEMIKFDGVPGKDYAASDYARVLMLSDDFAKYTAWKGVGDLPEEDKEKLLKAINEARRSRKFIRFWNTPDNEACWSLLVKLGAFVISTDKLTECNAVLNKLNN